ncbi:hypothetical protein GCM10027445_39550 [Amycolatopsis endophytica]|uniref:Uncharacterized protein n=1 Tax=Amycolatopsis endophytica TaxID=860233 RepID=A0A853B080_9PSEU|nr:hypothetical protein [Amycolatopsis endophytica]NYI88319.1 hypothetical protein [Amycolatopsis endophytica]
MSVTAFADETKASGYLLTVAALLPADLAAARQVMRGLVMPGQRRIHFFKESDRRRKQILDVIAEVRPRIALYDSSGHHRRQQRAVCLTALLADLAARQARTLVLERDDAVLAEDRKVLYRLVRDLRCSETLQYRHHRAHEEPLLAIPDALAWCWQRGGHWRTRVKEMDAALRVL